MWILQSSPKTSKNYANTRIVKIHLSIRAKKKWRCPLRGKGSIFKDVKEKFVKNTLGQLQRMTKRNSYAVNQIAYLFIRMARKTLLDFCAVLLVQLLFAYYLLSLVQLILKNTYTMNDHFMIWTKRWIIWVWILSRKKKGWGLEI